MSISVKFLQHPQAFAPEAEPRPVAQSKPQALFARPAPRRSRRAVRTNFTHSLAQAAEQETDSVFTAIVPPQPRSLFQRQMYLGNMALLGQVVQQKGIVQSVQALNKSGAGQGPGTGSGPDTVPGQFPEDPPIGEIGYALLARLIAISAQLADTHDVSLPSHLEKLGKFTKSIIAGALDLLHELKMPKTFAALSRATDRTPFERLIGIDDPDNEKFHRLLHIACQQLVAAQYWCILEAPDDPDDGAIGSAPAAAAAPAMAKAEAQAKVGVRRAQRTASATEKPVKPQRKR